MVKKEKNKYFVYLFVAIGIIAIVGILLLIDYFTDGLNLMGNEPISGKKGNDLVGKATELEKYDKCVQDCSAKKKIGVDTSTVSAAPKNAEKNVEELDYTKCIEACDKLGNQLNVFWCSDSDGDSPNAKYIKGITYSTYNPGGKVDECYTFFSGNVRLVEGKCVGNNYQLDYIDCEKGCKAGACMK